MAVLTLEVLNKWPLYRKGNTELRVLILDKPLSFRFDGMEAELEPGMALIYDGATLAPMGAEAFAGEGWTLVPETIDEPGEKAQVSGMYAQLDGEGVEVGRATVVKGEPLPPTKESGNRWVLIEATTKDDDVSPVQTSAVPPVEEWPKYQDKEDGGQVMALFAGSQTLSVPHPLVDAKDIKFVVEPGHYVVWDGEALDTMEKADFEASFRPHQATRAPVTAPAEVGALGRKFHFVTRMLMYAWVCRRLDIPVRTPGVSEFTEPKTGDYWVVTHKNLDGEDFLLVRLEPKQRFRDGCLGRIEEAEKRKGHLIVEVTSLRKYLAERQKQFDDMPEESKVKAMPEREKDVRIRNAQIEERELRIAEFDAQVEKERMKIGEWDPIQERLVPLYLVQADAEEAFYFIEGEDGRVDRSEHLDEEEG